MMKQSTGGYLISKSSQGIPAIQQNVTVDRKIVKGLKCWRNTANPFDSCTDDISNSVG